jgi:hypothetical protein
MMDFSGHNTENLMEIKRLIGQLEQMGFPLENEDIMRELNAEIQKRKDKGDLVTNDEKDFYERYIGKTVRVTKQVNHQCFFYKGKLIRVLENKIILIDEKVGQVMFSFDVIKAIEEV